MTTILCINGSDSMGHAGIQADVRTIQDLGAHAATAVTSVTLQGTPGPAVLHPLPTHLVMGQIRAIYDEVRPAAVKVGMVDDPDTIRQIRQAIVGCRHVVCSPVVVASSGGLLMSNDSLRAYCQHLIPICQLLIVRCTDAEILLGQRITTDADMHQATAQLHAMGAQWVLLRGGVYGQGRINALLSGPGCQRFFSSANVEGWQRHGVGGTQSTAIATRLALGDDVEQAVEQAHRYMHSQVVYASTRQQASVQTGALYERFMTLLSDNYTRAHDVAFYAEALSITPRYLSQITRAVCARSPKGIIHDYLAREGCRLLLTTTLTVQQVSLQLGFASQVTFAKFFRAVQGCTPSAFRNRGSSALMPPHEP